MKRIFVMSHYTFESLPVTGCRLPVVFREKPQVTGNWQLATSEGAI